MPTRAVGAAPARALSRARGLAITLAAAVSVAACGGQGAPSSATAPATTPAPAPGSIEANPLAALILEGYRAGGELGPLYRTALAEAMDALRGSADSARDGGAGPRAAMARAFLAALFSGEGMTDGALRSAMAAAKAALFAGALPDYVPMGAFGLSDFPDVPAPAFAPGGAAGFGGLGSAAAKTTIRSALRGSALLCVRTAREPGGGEKLYCLFAGEGGILAWVAAEELRFAPYDAEGGVLALALREGGGSGGGVDLSRRLVSIGKDGERSLLGEGALELGSELGAPGDLDMLTEETLRTTIGLDGSAPIGPGDYAIAQFHGFGPSQVPGCAALADIELAVELARDPPASASGRVEVHFAGPLLRRYCAIPRELLWRDGSREEPECARWEGALVRDGAALVLRMRRSMAGGDGELAFTRFVGDGGGLAQAWVYGLPQPNERFGDQDHAPFLGYELYPEPGMGKGGIRPLAAGDDHFAADAVYITPEGAEAPGLWLQLNVGSFIDEGMLPMRFETRETGWIFLGREGVGPR